MFNVRRNPVLALGALAGVIVLTAQVATAADKTAKEPTFRIQKASDLIGKAVVNPEGEQLGQIQDLAIDPEQGRVAYAVLSFGGVLGMGDKWFAVPTGALTLPEDAKRFVLAVDKDQLKNAPGFAKTRWPQMDNVTWGMETHEFYGQEPYWTFEGDDATPAVLRIQKASDVIGRRVQDPDGEKLGEIKDLVIDPDRYGISYAVLTFGGIMGFGNKLFAMPVSVLQMDGASDYAVLTVSKEQLKKAKGFDQNNWPNLADAKFAESTYKLYGQRPAWQEDLRGGRYVTSVVGQECSECGHKIFARGFVRQGETYCCAGCANETGCTCAKAAVKPGK